MKAVPSPKPLLDSGTSVRTFLYLMDPGILHIIAVMKYAIVCWMIASS
jgi:hypothetical protein